MKYGCIGERLGHSFSKEVHGAISDYEYELHEVQKNELDTFMLERDFLGINVTIPYKEAVIPYLHSISEKAKSVGAVNTVINKNGKLFGYNTDHYGMTSLIKYMGLDLSGKKVAILGTGGTAKTAYAVSYDLGASEILKISRTTGNGVVTYDELYLSHSDVQIIINTTPVGMYPNTDASPVMLDRLPSLEGIVDAVYNPLRTRLVTDAKKRGLKAEGGLYMLVAQAVKASELFTDTEYSENDVKKIYSAILSKKENIVLVGMPGSGKTTVGTIIAKELDLPFYDTDSLICEITGKQISDIFTAEGESGFRDIEEKVIKDRILHLNGAVIATGGGAILRKTNVDALKQNGKLYFLDRPLSSIIPTDDRPLSSNIDDLKKRYEERYPIYCSVCNVKITADSEPKVLANAIIKEHNNENLHN